MKNCILIIVTSLLFTTVMAQSGVVKITDGKIAEGDFFRQKIFVFDNFKDARVRMNDGTMYTGKLNISTIGQSLRIISESGDTIAIDAEKSVDVVSAGNQFFRKINNIYVEVLETNGEVSLGIARIMKIGQERVEGTYGGTNEVASISKMASVEVDSKIEKIVGTSSIRYDYTENLYLLKGSKLTPATRKNLEKLFGNKKVQIENFIRENNIRFSNNKDVIKLFEYISNNR